MMRSLGNPPARNDLALRLLTRDLPFISDSDALDHISGLSRRRLLGCVAVVRPRIHRHLIFVLAGPDVDSRHPRLPAGSAVLAVLDALESCV